MSTHTELCVLHNTINRGKDQIKLSKMKEIGFIFGLAVLIIALVFCTDQSRKPPVGLIQPSCTDGVVFVPRSSRISLCVDTADWRSMICLFDAVITNRSNRSKLKGDRGGRSFSSGEAASNSFL